MQPVLRNPTPAVALHGAFLKTAYSQALASSGGNAPIKWSLASGQLPPGMALSTTGVISGAGTIFGQYSFTVKAADSSSPQQSATASFTISVATNLSVSFSTQPSNTSSSASQITPAVKVQVVDNLGHSVSGATVQMSLGTNPTGATLPRTTGQTTGNNVVAIFSSLGISKKGSGDTLMDTVTNPPFAAVVASVPFNVQ